jgi:hypothetical protein
LSTVANQPDNSQVRGTPVQGVHESISQEQNRSPDKQRGYMR